MAPLIEELGKSLQGSARVLKIDIDKNEAVATHYQIQSVPTFIIFKKGEIVWRQAGMMDKNILEEQVKKFMD